MRKEVISNNKIKVIPENIVDIIILYFIFSNKKTIVEDEIYWQEKIDIGRKTVRHKRKKYRVNVSPYRAVLSNNLESIRLTGKILDAHPDDLIGKSVGLDIKINKEIVLETKNNIHSLIQKLEKDVDREICIVIVDDSGVVIGKVGSDIRVIMQEKISKNFKDRSLMEQLREILQKHHHLFRKNQYTVLGVNVATKKIIKYLKKIKIDAIIEGDYTSDIEGIIQVLKVEEIQDRFQFIRYVRLIKEYNDLIRRINTGRVLYGIEEIKYAISSKNVKHIYIIDKIILRFPDIINYIVEAIMKGIKVHIFNQFDEIGLLISRFGGIIGTY